MPAMSMPLAVSSPRRCSGDVGSAPRVIGFRAHLDDWHGGFRRDPADLSPDELIEHQIADDEDALGAATGDQVMEPAQVGHWT
jgi:hypothetical protein